MRNSTERKLGLGALVIVVATVAVVLSNRSEAGSALPDGETQSAESRTSGARRPGAATEETGENDRPTPEDDGRIAEPGEVESVPPRPEVERFLTELSGIEFGRDRFREGRLDDSALQRILLFVKRYGVTSDELLQSLRATETPEPIHLAALAFTSDFGPEHATWLASKVGVALGARADGSAVDSVLAATAAAHVLRLRGASKASADLLAEFVVRLEAQTTGVNGVNSVVGLLLGACRNGDNDALAGLARRVMSHDPTQATARSAVEALGADLPNFLSAVLGEVGRASTTRGMDFIAFAHANGPDAEPLVMNVIDRGRDALWPARKAALLGLAGIGDETAVRKLAEIVDAGREREGPYPGDLELLERSFAEQGAWDHLPGIVAATQTITSERGRAAIDAMVDRFLLENSRLGYSGAETRTARERTLRLLRRQSESNSAAKTCFRILGRIGTSSDIAALESAGRRLGMNDEAEVARGMIEMLSH